MSQARPRTLALAAIISASLLAGVVAVARPNRRPRIPRLPLPPDQLHSGRAWTSGTSCHSWATKVGRVAIFGIPLQQQWSHRIDGDRAPTYYLNSDAPLYYYSFTDAWIAMAYSSLPTEQRARFDPMITGFNPTDMYAADHIRRVLQTFPGVFTGIGEFTIHKEFVAAKIAGGTASLQDPALDRILDFAAEVGLVVLIHNDMDVPFAKEGAAAGLSRAGQGSLPTTPGRNHHLGPYGHGPYRPSDEGPCGAYRRNPSRSRVQPCLFRSLVG